MYLPCPGSQEAVVISVSDAQLEAPTAPVTVT